MSEPDWDALSSPEWTPLGDLCDTLADLPRDDLLQLLLMIGWRYGVLTGEDAERFFLTVNNKSGEEREAAERRFYCGLFCRVAQLAEPG